MLCWEELRSPRGWCGRAGERDLISRHHHLHFIWGFKAGLVISHNKSGFVAEESFNLLLASTAPAAEHDCGYSRPSQHRLQLLHASIVLIIYNPKCLLTCWTLSVSTCPCPNVTIKSLDSKYRSNPNWFTFLRGKCFCSLNLVIKMRNFLPRF